MQVPPGARLIDVRTPAEFRELHAEGAANVPLAGLDAARLAGESGGAPVVLLCRTGSRAEAARRKLEAAGHGGASVYEGGTLAWEAAGLPVVRGRKAVSLERQVRIGAGGLVLAGVALGLLAHPALFGLAGFVGAGLVFSGLTDTCGMGAVLARMPWNRAALALLALGGAAHAQDKSVKPGINDPFRNPDLAEWVTKFEGESRETFEKRREIVAACKLKPGESVADVGAGTGLFTRLFATAAGPTGGVTAVDIAPKFLAHVEKSARELGLTNVKTVLGADDSCKLPAASVDVIFVCDAYHHFEFPQKMLASMKASLKPGGRVVVVDFARIPGTSSDWVLGHVRAGQAEVEAEFAAAGFAKLGEAKGLLRENYLVTFGLAAGK